MQHQPAIVLYADAFYLLLHTIMQINTLAPKSDNLPWLLIFATMSSHQVSLMVYNQTLPTNIHHLKKMVADSVIPTDLSISFFRSPLVTLHDYPFSCDNSVLVLGLNKLNPVDPAKR